MVAGVQATSLYTVIGLYGLQYSLDGINGNIAFFFRLRTSRRNTYMGRSYWFITILLICLVDIYLSDSAVGFFTYITTHGR